MFVGHFAVGLASKRWAPRTSLGWLLLAPVLLDVLWPVFCLLGIERFRVTPGGNPFLNLTFDWYPWSHSLLMAVVWGGVLGGLWLWRTGDGRVAAVLAIGVVSHWVLDWITHLPDMPLWPGGPLLGLGLWRSVPATFAVESVMLMAGVWLYYGATRSRDGVGSVGAWLFLVLLSTLYAMSIVAPPPAPGSERTIAMVALVGVLLAPLAGWIDHHREPVPG
jgi:membrane-bound metal-dependent hydrolase YbcI (DUF457 family)